ncbi:MAG: DUF6695 family protein [Bacteroidales bacterium]
MKHIKNSFFLLALLIKLIFIVGCAYESDVVITQKSEIDNATLIVMAYPEAIVRTTPSLYSDILPYLGMGVPGRIRAGHACMVIVKEGSSEFEYFDFGRYITPDGYSRVRGKESDPETKVDVVARWDGKQLLNVEELLQWLYNHPEKTHGSGDLYASVSEVVNYERVKEYIDEIQKRELLPYGPFVKNGSNCSRFVTGAMYHGILDEDVQDEIELTCSFTPSVLANVEAANTYDYYYVVNEESVSKLECSLLATQVDLLFDNGEGYAPYTSEGSIVSPKDVEAQDDWHWLGGIGSGAWYEVEETDKYNVFKVSQYNSQGKREFSSNFLANSDDLVELESNFRVIYPAHFRTVTLKIGNDTIRLNRIKNNV